MYIDILIEALDNLWALSTRYPDYKRAAIKEALDEVHEQKKLMDYELLKGQVHIISLTTALETVNMALYDEFGRDAKKLKRDGVPYTFHRFHNMARNSMLSDMTIEMLRDGFEYLEDLWNDNETYGNNNPDGSFAYNHDDLQGTSVETIRSLLEFKCEELYDLWHASEHEDDKMAFSYELEKTRHALEDLNCIYT